MDDIFLACWNEGKDLCMLSVKYLVVFFAMAMFIALPLPAYSQDAGLLKVFQKQIEKDVNGVFFQSTTKKIVIKSATLNKGKCSGHQSTKLPVELKYGETFSIAYYVGLCSLTSAEVVTDQGEYSWKW